ncbi:MAG: 6-pyruvoyl-tetrahydropterin synthase-related protein [Anaerolineales bacterium]
MQRPTHQVDVLWIAMLALCILLAWPWLIQDGLPNPQTAGSSIARQAEIAHNLQQGIIYSRWASHFHYGFGSPLFNYMAPAPHFIGGLYNLLLQTPPDATFRNLMAFCLILAGVGMFAFARRLTGDAGGVFAGMCYSLSPAILYTPHFQTSDLGVGLATSLFPLFLWSLDRLRERDERDLGLVAFLGGLLIMTHTLLGPLLFGVGLIWWLWMIASPTYNTWRLGGLAGIVLGVGGSAIFWLPALAEMDAVHWVPVQDVWQTLRWRDVLSPPLAPDNRVLNPLPLGALGTGPWVLGLMGLLWLGLLRMGQHRSLVIFWGILGISTVLCAVLLPSRWLDNIAHFPTLTRADLLVIPAAGGSIIAGALGGYLQAQIARRAFRHLAHGLMLIIILGGAWNVVTPPDFIPYRTTDPLREHMQAELRGLYAGSFQHGSLLPAHTTELPPPSYALVESFEEGRITKVDRASRLPTTNIAILSHSPTRDTLRINNNTSMIVEILTLYFRGWRAEFQDQPLEVFPNADTGLMIATVPPGNGELSFFLDSTTGRRTAEVLFGMSVTSATLLTLFWRQTARSASVQGAAGQKKKSGTFGLAMWVVIALLGVTAARADNNRGDTLENISPSPFVFDGGLDLLGYELSSANVTPAQSVNLTLYWQAARPNLPNYYLEILMVDPETNTPLAQIGHIAPGGWQTSQWQTNKLMRDTYRLDIPARVSSGQYELRARARRCQQTETQPNCIPSTALQVFSVRGTPLGDFVTLPVTIHVR